MRTLCHPSSPLHRVFRSKPIPSNTTFFNHLPNFCRLVTKHGQKVSYSVRVARSSRSNTKPSSFLKDAQTQFNKARHESIYLYKALSNSSYIFGCYVSGILMITAGIYNHSTIAWANDKAIEDKTPLPSFIPVFTFVGSLFLVGFGSYIIFAKPRNLCQSIRSLPPTKVSSNKALLLEIERAQWLPFIRPGTLRVAPSDLTLIGSVKAEQRLRLSRSPLNDAGLFAPVRLFQDAIRGIFRAVTNSGYLKLRVPGYFFAWKLDSRLAWAFEEGEALESLIEVTASDKR